jgi:hypothetical protein
LSFDVCSGPGIQRCHQALPRLLAQPVGHGIARLFTSSGAGRDLRFSRAKWRRQNHGYPYRAWPDVPFKRPWRVAGPSLWLRSGAAARGISGGERCALPSAGGQAGAFLWRAERAARSPAPAARHGDAQRIGSGRRGRPQRGKILARHAATGRAGAGAGE